MAKKPRRVVGRPLSMAHERGLLRILQPMIRQVQATLKNIKTPRDARALGSALKRQWSDARIRKLIAQAGTPAERAGSRVWLPIDRKIRSDVMDANGRRRKPYDGAALLEQWSKETAADITSVRDEVAEALRKDIVAALEAGTPPEVLAERWRRRGIPVGFGTLEGRVKVIAQHQINSLNARVQKERARSVGVKEFVWRSQEDEDVRKKHQALNRRVFSYKDPPSEGLPGEPINCRCWAQSVVPADLIEDLDLGSILDSG